MQQFEILFDELSSRLTQIRDERRLVGMPRLAAAQIRLIGQFSLMLNHKVKLSLTATKDVDALIEGEHIVTREFKDLLGQHSLVLDPVAHEAWIPPEGKFELFYESEVLKVYLLDHFSVILSKAIKAPQKNKILVEQAIDHYGKELCRLIEKYGGDLNYFKS